MSTKPFIVKGPALRLRELQPSNLEVLHQAYILMKNQRQRDFIDQYLIGALSDYIAPDVWIAKLKDAVEAAQVVCR